MLCMKLLGGAQVERDGVPVTGAAAQRKSLAVLGLLGAAGERGMSRDKILAYLWPEVELEKAAHRLTQILYALRRDLGIDDLFLGSGDLRLNPARVSSDLCEFEAVRREGNLERAVELYRGPFLDGFFLSDALEFERWVENERVGLRQRVVEALETLAAAAAAAGDYRRAAGWWQRLAEHDPLSSRVTVHLMSALAAAGNRAGALDRAQSYQVLLQRELGAAPNPAVLALADQLRRQPREGGFPRPSSAAPLVPAIAVLPFANLSAVPANDYFVEGLTEEVRNALAETGIKVAARISVDALWKPELDACEMGRRLKVNALLEGSVRQAGAQIRLNVQLIGTTDGCQFWSASHELLVTNAFAAQDHLAALVVTGVRGALAGLSHGGPARGTGSA
jgi:DNA-binding SARP family transcriptional activator/TolB-like protein